MPKAMFRSPTAKSVLAVTTRCGAEVDEIMWLYFKMDVCSRGNGDVVEVRRLDFEPCRNVM
jgi:hypothetical protein